MHTEDITISNKLGLHARAATKLVQLASRHPCNITIDTGNKQADAKSIMSVLMLAGKQGMPVTIKTEGEDAEAALQDVVQLFNDKFGEPE